MTEPVIQIEQLVKAYGSQHVLQNVSLSIPAGQRCALGRNGAGKTTMIRILLGLLPADSGVCRLGGVDPAVDPLKVRSNVGYLAEDQTMYGWMTPVELCRFLAPFYPTWDMKLARDSLDRFEIPSRSYGDELGGYTDHELAQYRWIAMALSLPLLAIIGRLFITRYGALSGSSTPAKRRRFRIALPPILARIPIRLPGRLPAMIWLELRQSVPLAAFGFVLGVLMTIASVLIERQHGYSFGISLLMDLPSSMFVVAMLWAVVVGSGLYSADLSSGLGAFWRSRPISPDLWFWTKFVVGLAAVVGVLDGVTILVSWKSPRGSMTTGMSWAYVGCFPIIHALMYALAVLGTCWFRRPVIGGILAILGYTLLTVAITTFPMTNRWNQSTSTTRCSSRNAPGKSISSSMVIRLSTVYLWSRLSCSRSSHADWPDHFSQHPAGSCHKRNNRSARALFGWLRTHAMLLRKGAIESSGQERPLKLKS